MQQELGPEADIRAALAALPGGPDEEVALCALHGEHRVLAQQLRDTLRRCDSEASQSP